MENLRVFHRSVDSSREQVGEGGDNHTYSSSFSAYVSEYVEKDVDNAGVKFRKNAGFR